MCCIICSNKRGGCYQPSDCADSDKLFGFRWQRHLMCSAADIQTTWNTDWKNKNRCFYTGHRRSMTHLMNMKTVVIVCFGLADRNQGELLETLNWCVRRHSQPPSSKCRMRLDDGVHPKNNNLIVICYMFCSPLNISGASEQNNVAAFS